MKRTKPGSGTDYLQFMHDRHHQAMIQKFAKPAQHGPLAASASEAKLPVANAAKRK